MTESIITDRRPPYVPYQTFANFLADHDQGLPNRLDSKVLETVGGTLRSQLIAALKFLALIDDDKSVKPELQTLVRATGDVRKKLLADILRGSYTFLFSANGFDIEQVADTDFRKQFEKAGVSNDVLRKAVTFFLLAATDAEIPISRFIQTPSRRTASKGPRQKKVRSGGEQKTPADNSSTPPPVKKTPEVTKHTDDAQAVIQSFEQLFLVVADLPQIQKDIVLEKVGIYSRLVRGRG